MKTRILYVITKSNFGGAQRYVYELATSLPRDSYEVAVACGGNGILAQKLREAQIPIFEIKSFQRDINLKKEFLSFFELFAVIRQFKPHIVHLNSSKAGGVGSFVSRICGVRKIIFTAHGWPFWEDRSLPSRVLIWFFSWLTTIFAHTVIVVSAFEYKRTILPFTKHKCVIIRTAVPPITFKNRHDARALLRASTASEKHLWVGSSSEHTRNKNLKVAIDAVALHNKANRAHPLHYVIMGDGELRHELETYVAEQHLEDSIVFTGYVDDARTYLKAFDIFLLPSLKEGMPYGVLEAGAAELPCIVSNIGGLPEVIEHEQTGLLMNPKDTTSIVTALTTLSSDVLLRQRYGHALHEKIIHSFSQRAMYEATQKVYSTT